VSEGQCDVYLLFDLTTARSPAHVRGKGKYLPTSGNTSTVCPHHSFPLTPLSLLIFPSTIALRRSSVRTLNWPRILPLLHLRLDRCLHIHIATTHLPQLRRVSTCRCIATALRTIVITGPNGETCSYQERCSVNGCIGGLSLWYRQRH
jgi:hypothetical protein